MYENGILKHDIMASRAFGLYSNVSLCNDKSSQQAN